MRFEGFEENPCQFFIVLVGRFGFEMLGYEIQMTVDVEIVKKNL